MRTVQKNNNVKDILQNTKEHIGVQLQGCKITILRYAVII